MKLLSQRHKTGSTVLGIMLISMLIAACGNSGGGAGSAPSNAAAKNGKGCMKVGVLLPETATSERWDKEDRPLLTNGIKAALGAGSDVIYTNAEGNSSEQQTQAEAALTQGACILVVAPVDSAASAAIVSKAKPLGIPVIAYDRLIQSKDVSYYVSFDNVKVGNIQGQYIVDHYKSYTQNGKNVAMISGAQTDSNGLAFRQGALQTLQPLFSNGSLKKVYDQFTPNWDNDRARVEMDGVLTANQDNVQIAYVANDGMANTVIAALKAKKLNGKVLVTGQDATVAGLQNIITGDQAMTVFKDYTKEAQATINLVKALHDGSDTMSLTSGITVKTSDGTAIPSILETPISVDKTNIAQTAQTLIKENLMTSAQFCSGLPKGAGGICP